MVGGDGGGGCGPVANFKPRITKLVSFLKRFLFNENPY